MATFGTFTAGQVLTAAELNAAGTWTDYTPSWTQSATITKTVGWGRYSQFNKIVMGSVKMTATSAGTANNKILIGLPVAASSNNFVMGTVNFFKSGSGYLLSPMTAIYETSTTIGFSVVSSSLSATVNASSDVRFGQNGSPIVGTSFTGPVVASGDIVWVQFIYEAA